MDFDDLLKLMVEKGGSDMFITAGVPPSVKINGKIVPITKNPLSPDVVREVVMSIMSEDQRLHSPAAERNRQPILEVLQQALPPQGRAIEIACGTGQHAVHFAAALPGWHWQPTDPDSAALASTAAYRADAGLPNLAAPRRFDLLRDPWPVEAGGPPLDLVFVSNLLHIAPWPVCAALFDGAARVLADGDASVLFQAQTNLRFGCVILRHYLNVENGDLFLALGRYNGSRGKPQYPTAVFAAQRNWIY